MEAAQHKRRQVIVIDDLWAELGMTRPSALLNPLPVEPLRLSRPWHRSLTAVVLTIALHALLSMGMLTDFGGISVQSHVRGNTDQQATQNANGRMVMVLLLSEQAVDQAEADSPVTGTMAETPELMEPLAATPIVESPKSDGQATVVSSATGPGSQPRTLEDIYMGQIKARIERAWSDSQGTRLAVGNCQVNIQQGKQGEVIAVSFGRCIATEGWRNSLAQAIRYASPLPAPPEQKVFSDEVSLEF